MMACRLLQQYGPLAGRILLAIIFILSGFNKITGWDGTLGYMSSKGLPFTEILLILSIIIELGGGLMILLGLYARSAAVVIFLFVIPVTLVFHNFWAVDPAEQQTQMIQFLKNLAIMGGMLYIAAFGSGRYSLKNENC